MITRRAKEGIDAYVDYGVPTGDFLQAVLSNDLMEACSRADDDHQHALFDICSYIWNYTPSVCWGSKSHYETWLQLHKEAPERAKQIAEVDLERRQRFTEAQ